MSEESCAWTEDCYDNSYWKTACGKEFVLNDGAPAENGFRFCCFCGKPLREVKAVVCVVCHDLFVPTVEGQVECDPLGCPDREEAER